MNLIVLFFVLFAAFIILVFFVANIVDFIRLNQIVKLNNLQTLNFKPEFGLAFTLKGMLNDEPIALQIFHKDRKNKLIVYISFDSNKANYLISNSFNYFILNKNESKFWLGKAIELKPGKRFDIRETLDAMKRDVKTT